MSWGKTPHGRARLGVVGFVERDWSPGAGTAGRGNLSWSTNFVQASAAGGVLRFRIILDPKVSLRYILALSTCCERLAMATCAQSAGPVLTLVRRKSFPLARANTVSWERGTEVLEVLGGCAWSHQVAAVTGDCRRLERSLLLAHAVGDRIWGRGRTRLAWRCQSPGKARGSCLAKFSPTSL